MNAHNKYELPPLPEPLCNLPTYCQDAIRQYTRSVLDDQDAVIEANRQAKGEYVLAKHQPCGCVICTCEDNGQCQGCGARHCGTHPIAKFSNPIYETPSEKARGNADASANSGEPVAWLRNERGNYQGKAVFDPMVLLSSPTPGFFTATYSPVYTSPQPRQIPEGYKLVPIEPTDEMIEAGCALYDSSLRQRYKAMLEALPEVKP